MSIRKRKINKVLLIACPTRFAEGFYYPVVPHIGLGYLAAVLEQNKIEVEILDSLLEGYDQLTDDGKGFIRRGLSQDQMIQWIAKSNADLVGVSCMFALQHRMTVNLVKALKEADPETLVAVGGLHASNMGREIVEASDADAVFIGESEDTLLDFIRRVEAGDSLDHIDGIVFRDASGELRENPKTKFIEDLDTIPFPARHLMQMDRYNMGEIYSSVNDGHVTNFVTTRGCPFRCDFCSLVASSGHIFRERSPENVLAEMEQLYNEFGIREFQVYDDNFSLNKKRTHKILDGIIERGWDIAMRDGSTLGVFTLDEPMIVKMKQSGWYCIDLAIESGVPRVLNDLMKKPTKFEMIEPVVEMCKKHKLMTNASFIIGYPGETMEECAITCKFAIDLDLDEAHVYIATPFPGSPLFDTYRDNGWFPDDMDPADLSELSGLFLCPEHDRDALIELADSVYGFYREKQAKSWVGHQFKLGVVFDPRKWAKVRPRHLKWAIQYAIDRIRKK